MEKRNNKIRKDDLEHELRNTTVGQFRELSKAIQELGKVTVDDLCKTTQTLGEALNSVPPYNYERQKSISIFRIIKNAVVTLALLSLLMFIIQQL